MGKQIIRQPGGRLYAIFDSGSERDVTKSKAIHQGLTGVACSCITLGSAAILWPGWVGSILILAAIFGGVAIERSICDRPAR